MCTNVVDTKLPQRRLAETSEKLVLAETTLTSRGVTAIQRQESQLEASAKYRFVRVLLF